MDMGYFPIDIKEELIKLFHERCFIFQELSASQLLPEIRRDAIPSYFISYFQILYTV